MATAVWKYPAHLDGAWAVEMPEGAKVIRFAMQDGEPRMWAHVDPAAPLRGRAFRVYGTGHHSQRRDTPGQPQRRALGVAPV